MAEFLTERHHPAFDSRNHLIIGLGGTGGKVIRAFRKKVYEQFRSHDPATANVEYLYVDSSDEFMQPNDPTWKILGTSVQLESKNQLHLSDNTLRQVVENANNYPGIRPWIGSKEQLRDTLGSDTSVKVFGGQRRRLGRFLFAQKVRDFNEKVQRLIRDLTDRSKDGKATIHICAGLAGGTGSGSLLDAVAQVRREFPDTKALRIIVYVFLPEAHPKPGWDAGNYHANGYAALLELNALAERRWQPHDVSGTALNIDPHGDGRLALVDPFTACYVFTDTNERDQARDVDLEVPETLAQFLYQKTVVLTDPATNPLRRWEDFENYPQSAPEVEEGTNLPLRSRRFFTFGIKQLSYPEEEIREYLTFDFVSQATLQLLYNNWSDEFGYLDQSRNQDFHEQVREKGSLGRWKLSDDHITLGTGILVEEIQRKGRVPFSQEWEALITQIRVKEFGTPLVEKVVAHNDSLNTLKRELAQHFESGFRQAGVKAFFQQKARSCDEHATEIARVVQEELFGQWRDGERSLEDVERFLSALIENVQERRRLADDRIARLREDEKKKAQTVLENDREWAKVGPVGRILGKLNQIYTQQSTHLHDLFLARTQIEAWQFAAVLLPKVAARLESVLGPVKQLKARLIDAGTKATHEVESRLATRGIMDVRRPVVRYFDDDLVREVARRLTRDQKVQETQTRAVRQRLASAASGTASFEKLLDELTVARLVDLLSGTCEEQVRDAHAELQNSRQRLLGVSVLGKLADEFAGDHEKLSRLARELVGAAGDFVKFSMAEINRTGDGCEPWGGAARGFAVVLPEDKAHQAFRDRLIQGFHNASWAAQKLVASHQLMRDGTPIANEITLLTFSNCLPLRYIEQVSDLRTKYLARLNGPEGQRARYQLHSEGDGGHLPDLFPPAPGTVRQLALTYLLLAQPLGLVQRLKVDGQSARLYLITKDADGFDADPVEIGRDELRASDSMASSVVYRLKDQVEAMVRPRALSDAARNEIADWLRSKAEESKAALGLLSEEYKQVNSAIRQAYSIAIPKE